MPRNVNNLNRKRRGMSASTTLVSIADRSHSILIRAKRIAQTASTAGSTPGHGRPAGRDRSSWRVWTSFVVRRALSVDPHPPKRGRQLAGSRTRRIASPEAAWRRRHRAWRSRNFNGIFWRVFGRVGGGVWRGRISDRRLGWETARLRHVTAARPQHRDPPTTPADAGHSTCSRRLRALAVPRVACVATPHQKNLGTAGTLLGRSTHAQPRAASEIRERDVARSIVFGRAALPRLGLIAFCARSRPKTVFPARRPARWEGLASAVRPPRSSGKAKKTACAHAATHAASEIRSLGVARSIVFNRAVRLRPCLVAFWAQHLRVMLHPRPTGTLGRGARFCRATAGKPGICETTA